MRNIKIMRQCNDHLYNDQKNRVVVTNFLVIAKCSIAKDIAGIFNRIYFNLF